MVAGRVSAARAAGVVDTPMATASAGSAASRGCL